MEFPQDTMPRESKLRIKSLDFAVRATVLSFNPTLSAETTERAEEYFAFLCPSSSKCDQGETLSDTDKLRIRSLSAAIRAQDGDEHLAAKVITQLAETYLAFLIGDGSREITEAAH